MGKDKCHIGCDELSGKVVYVREVGVSDVLGSDHVDTSGGEDAIEVVSFILLS